MEDKAKANGIVEIDLKRLWKAILRKIWLVILGAVLGAVIARFGTIHFITPTYTASAMMYVNKTTPSVGDAISSITAGDLALAKTLVDSYTIILETRTSLQDVIDYAGLKRSVGQLRGMVSASSVNSTEIFEVVVTGPDPVETEKIANAIAHVLPKRISSIIDGASAKIVDYAVKPEWPSSPNYSQNTTLGLVIGLAIALAFIVLRELFDITIRSEEDVERSCSHPILAAVPDMRAPSKATGYYYNETQKKTKKKKKKKMAAGTAETTHIGKDINFAALESYKLLRTKLQFSFVDQPCPVIGVSSALAGEGKSLTSVNLAYSLAQLNKRVLLIDGDMRRPTLSNLLPVSKMPGLSNYLTGQIGMDLVIQNCRIDTEEGFDVIASGRVPPNPIELISSTKMSKAMEQLRASYDYIIMDLPPVGEVSDALVAAKLVDGILLVVRQDYCNTVSLCGAVSQFEFIDTRILGIVLNCVSESSIGYGPFGKKYYTKYYSKYRGSRYYAAAAQQNKNSASEGGRHGSV